MKRDLTVGCTGCAAAVSGDRRYQFLHNVRHRSTFHHLCTACVLKFHPGSFCPTCLDLFDPSPPSDYIKCSKCTSLAHSSCVFPETAAASSSYTCPSCSSPSFSFFNLSYAGKRSRFPDDQLPQRVIDLKEAKALLCAARIAAASMNKAAASARLDAERKVREAAIARKRAREALEIVTSVAAKERKGFSQNSVAAKERKGFSQNSVAAKERKGFSQNSVSVAAEQNKKPKGNGMTTAVTVQNRIQSRKLDSLSNAGLKGREKSVGFPTPAGVLDRRMTENRDIVEESDLLTGSPSSVLGRQNLQSNDVDVKKKMQVFSGPSIARNLQTQNSRVLEEEKGEMKGSSNSDMGLTKTPRSKQDALVSKANPGPVFTGSSNAMSLIS